MKEQKHNASYSKADMALNDNAIWLIVPIVITAISIIYWAEWAGNEVQHYYELKQGSFIHLIVIPLTVAVERAKFGLNPLTYILYGPIQYRASAPPLGPLRSESSCLGEKEKMWCAELIQISPRLLSFSREHRAMNDCREDPPKNV